ncbi:MULTISPECIES: GNAT family N-acetyltransferase [unclassified Ornithinimicrobium]|uniref:GNAT family N-acetyltransferase n=1 Tax=unclassified Ornithinimicrobium TaxID=2615080 RepID=UPI0038526873
MDIHHVDPDGDLVPRLARLGEEVGAVDSPWAHPLSLPRWRNLLRRGWDGEAPTYWLGLQDGAVVGSAGLWVGHYDNLDAAWLDLCVHPEHRRHGHGTRLLAHLQAQARAAGRTVVGVDAWEHDAARAFAARSGYEQRSVGVSRRQHLARLPEGWEEAVELARTTHAAAYELVRVAGALPEELLEPVAVLWHGINDAPTDDLILEDEAFPPERVRGYEEAQLAGQRLYHLVARHRSSGELGGHTIVAVDEGRPHLADQHDTTVAPTHRGNRLGLVLKGEMLRWLRDVEPQVEEISTWNAESNAHMIAVNEQLGYEVLGRALSFQTVLID